MAGARPTAAGKSSPRIDRKAGKGPALVCSIFIHGFIIHLAAFIAFHCFLAALAFGRICIHLKFAVKLKRRFSHVCTVCSLTLIDAFPCIPDVFFRSSVCSGAILRRASTPFEQGTWEEASNTTRNRCSSPGERFLAIRNDTWTLARTCKVDVSAVVSFINLITLFCGTGCA